MSQNDPTRYGGNTFIIDDYPRLDRCYEAERAEVAALRQLVRDMVEATVPSLPTMSGDLWMPEDWQTRARTVCAGVPLVKVPYPTEGESR